MSIRPFRDIKRRKTKDDVTIHIVKLENKGVLKFGEDCEFID